MPGTEAWACASAFGGVCMLASWGGLLSSLCTGAGCVAGYVMLAVLLSRCKHAGPGNQPTTTAEMHCVSAMHVYDILIQIPKGSSQPVNS